MGEIYLKMKNKILILKLNNFLNSKSVSIFVFSLSFSLFSLAAYLTNSWNSLAFPRIKMNLSFADLRSITYSLECNKSIELLRDNINNCDPYGRPLNYPRLILDIFRIFKIDISHTNLIGFLFGIIFIAGIIIFLFKTINNTEQKFLITSFFICSYPSQLVLERGNYDSLVLTCMLLIPLCTNSSSNNKFTKNFLGIFFSYLIINFKIFPASGLLLWSFYKIRFSELPKKLLKNIFYLFAIIISTIVTFKTNNISIILKNTPKPFGESSFGFLTLYQNINNNLIIYLLVFIKFFLILIYTYRSFKISRKNNLKLNQQNDLLQNYFILFSLQTITLYFLSRSFDYRLIFIIGFLPILCNYWNYISSMKNIQLIEYFPFLLIFVFYQEYLPYSFNIKLYSSFISDIILQPILIGFLIGITLYILKINPKLNK